MLGRCLENVMSSNLDPARSVGTCLLKVRRRKALARGLGLVEVVVVVAVISFLVLCVLIVLPKGRETSRMAGCQRNLMQIGVAVQLYEQANRHYPITPSLGDRNEGDSTVFAMLKALTLPDFLDLRDPKQPPKPTEAPGRGARVPGLTCPSDSFASSGASSTALSYRSNVGDGFDAKNGPFSPEILVTPANIEAANGLSFTSGFAERLVGTGRDGEPGPMNYAEVAGPLTGPCGKHGEGSKWRGDAGSSWAASGWRSTLYSHAVPPNPTFSCLAEDGITASMTASSPHPGRLNVLMLDGSLRGVTPTINRSVWKAMGSTQPAANSTVEPGR